MITRTCEACSNEFHTYPSEVRHGKGRFCSRNCAHKSPIARAQRSINARRAWRDPEIRARLEAGIAARSDSVAWQNSPQFQTGAAHPKYKGNKCARLTEVGRYQYVKWRKAVFTSDNYTCQRCGVRGRLHAHHIKSWAEYPALRYEVCNGETVCIPCHSLIHGKTIVEPVKACEHCSRIFKLKRNTTRFCSIKCFGASISNAVTLICPICSRQFTRARAVVGKTKSGFNFCSSKCKEAYYRSR